MGVAGGILSDSLGHFSSVLGSESVNVAYLSSSLDLCMLFFLRFGTGILHSMENATQLVQGTPNEAASHRTAAESAHRHQSWTASSTATYLCARGKFLFIRSRQPVILFIPRFSRFSRLLEVIDREGASVLGLLWTTGNSPHARLARCLHATC